jgi:hypothetical protein
MSSTIATSAIQMQRVSHPSPAGRMNSVAGFVSNTCDTKRTAAERKHFRHKWQLINTSRAIEGLKDLLPRSYLHIIASAKSSIAHEVKSPFLS